MNAARIKALAAEHGFQLSGIASAVPHADAGRYLDWVDRGMAGAMGYLTDRRADLRRDPRLLLPTARSIVCVGLLYNRPEPYGGSISRYACGDDYHDVLREKLERLAGSMGTHDYKICVDTAPLLERSYAREAGLGWIGKNTCLIHEPLGSWFFLGEILTSLVLEPDAPPPDRCGTCTRCIDACPTQAIVDGGYTLDARLCISYYTIELRGPIPEEARPSIGHHVFGCDICQDVCPWNRRAPVTDEPAFEAGNSETPLEEMAALSEAEFRVRFGNSPVKRAKYAGFLRNVAIAMGNSGNAKFRAPLEHLAAAPDPLVSDAARWALRRPDAHGLVNESS